MNCKSARRYRLRQEVQPALNKVNCLSKFNEQRLKNAASFFSSKRSPLTDAFCGNGLNNGVVVHFHRLGAHQRASNTRNLNNYYLSSSGVSYATTKPLLRAAVIEIAIKAGLNVLVCFISHTLLSVLNKGFIAYIFLTIVVFTHTQVFS